MSTIESQITQLFVQLFVQVQIEKNIKPLGHWLLWRESTSDQWIPITNGQLYGKYFHLIRS